MEFIHYIRLLSSVTMPTCDVLLRHFRKMLLYMQGYAVAYSHLLSTLDSAWCATQQNPTKTVGCKHTNTQLTVKCPVFLAGLCRVRLRSCDAVFSFELHLAPHTRSLPADTPLSFSSAEGL